MQIYYKWQTFYIRDTSINGYNHYILNTGEFTKTLYETKLYDREWRMEIKLWLDYNL